MKPHLVLFFAVILSACSGVRVINSEANEGFLLNKYRTFDFYKLEGTGDTTANFPKNAELLKQEISKQLVNKGLQRETSNPDLLINIGIVVEEKVQTRETSFADAPRYMGQRNYTWKSEEVEVGRYKEGTVTVHLVEAATKKLMWQGAVEGILPNTQEKLPVVMNEAITALFAKLQ